MRQSTLRKTITFSGVGLHSGRSVLVRLLPTGRDRGIRFIRTDLPERPVIKALGPNVIDTNYATTLGAGGASVGTVEHILAALYALGLDNVDIEVHGSEVPILDGSAVEFVKKIEAVGLVRLEAGRNCLVVKSPIEVREGEKYLRLIPSHGPGLSIDYSIDFDHSLLSKQTYSMQCTPDVFIEEIADARTFGFLSDIEMLRANGLAMGGSLSNAVVVGESQILNEDGLRYPDEFVRHKVLDLIGDLSLLGAQVHGHIIAHRSGHALNHRLIQKILRQRSRWEMMSGTEPLEKPFSSMGFRGPRREALAL